MSPSAEVDVVHSQLDLVALRLSVPHGPARINTTPTGVNAQYHQHCFCARLDVAVDGPHNTVVEVDVVPLPASPDNPYNNAFGPKKTPLLTEMYLCTEPHLRPRFCLPPLSAPAPSLTSCPYACISPALGPAHCG